ncbi:MAG: cell division protein FtsQ/DivIB [Candidatus Kaelpia aquatica]|nr:cell division protein FtsQ/DivIB [Candidatus Kaelpia aquatica]
MFKKIDYEKIKTALFFLSWAFLILLLVWFFGIMQDYKISSSSFRVKDVSVIFSDGSELDKDDAFRYLNIKKEDSIFKIDPVVKIKEVFKKHPEILKLSLHKQMPGKITANVTNRISVAQVHLGRYYPLDAEGFVLPFPSNFRIESLPLIRGVNPGEVAVASSSDNTKIGIALELLNLIDLLLGTRDINFDIDVNSIEDVNLVLINDIKVKLGKGGFKDKLMRLKLVLDDMEAKKLNPAIVDLRFDKAVLIPR